jgi:hypothetical protein
VSQSITFQPLRTTLFRHGAIGRPEYNDPRTVEDGRTVLEGEEKNAWNDHFSLRPVPLGTVPIAFRGGTEYFPNMERFCGTLVWIGVSVRQGGPSGPKGPGAG